MRLLGSGRQLTPCPLTIGWRPLGAGGAGGGGGGSGRGEGGGGSGRGFGGGGPQGSVRGGGSRWGVHDPKAKRWSQAPLASPCPHSNQTQKMGQKWVKNGSKVFFPKMIA